MKLRLMSDNWDYGTVGETVELDNIKPKVGDVYSIRIYSGDSYRTVNCPVVNKQDEYSDKRIPLFMGLYRLNPNERIEGIVKKYSSLKVGDRLDNLIVTES